MKVSLFEDNSFKESNILLIELVRPKYKDTFSTLCEDLIDRVRDEPDEHKFIKAVINQLEKWKILFAKSRVDGLSVEEQQGLYGEMYLLRKLITEQLSNPMNIVKYWVGDEAAIQDFKGKNWAVEVKTTSGGSAQLITVNGERQLDESDEEYLFLYHYSVEVSNQNGETLPEIINEIREKLSADLPAQSLFNEKLLMAGYMDEQSDSYTKYYRIRKEACYKVDDDFPRIKENELRDGVSNVQYSISITHCMNFLVPEDRIFNIIKDND